MFVISAIADNTVALRDQRTSKITTRVIIIFLYTILIASSSQFPQVPKRKPPLPRMRKSSLSLRRYISDACKSITEKNSQNITDYNAVYEYFIIISECIQ